MKLKEKSEAINLRKVFGYSVNKIAQKLNVSKGTVSLWVRDVPLAENQKKTLRKNKCFAVGNTFIRDKYFKIRKSYQKEGKFIAQNKDPLFYFGCALYWGEGSKAKNSVRLINSDLNMLKFFISFLKKFFNVKDTDIKLGINCYDNNGISVQDIEKYWLKNLNLPKTSLVKTRVNCYSKYSSRKKIGKLIYGTARILVYQTSIVQKIFGAIQEIAQFETKDWDF